MAKVDPLQESFIGGEFSPDLFGLISNPRYKSGLALSRNWISTLQGPLVRRTGTKYAGEAKFADKEAIFVPFEFSTTQSYILEFGDQYVRFWTNHGRVTLIAENITAITNANPCVVTYDSGDTYANGDYVVLSGIVGPIGGYLNGRAFKVAGVNTVANTFQLQYQDGTPVDSTAMGAYTSGGTVAEILEVATNYTEADLDGLRWVQSADVLYLVHPNYFPRALTRLGATSWTYAQIAFIDLPYLSLDSSGTTLTPSGTSGAVTITASAATFSSDDVGRQIRIKNGATWGNGVIDSYTSPTQVGATVLAARAFASTSATVQWRLGVWSDTSGYPSTVCFYEDRLCFGGMELYPLRVDGSRTGDYLNFAPSDLDGTITDSHAVAFNLNSGKLDKLRWLVSDEQALAAGSYSGESAIRGGGTDSPITPTSISVKSTLSRGSSDVAPIKIGKSILHVQRGGKVLRELIYRFETGYNSIDISEIGKHLFQSGIKRIEYQQLPYSVLWVLTEDGELRGITYDRVLDEFRIACHRHDLGGVGDADGNPPIIKSFGVIPLPDGTSDELWLLVERYIDGETVRYLEYLTQPFSEDASIEDAYFLDGGLTYDGAAATTITGLSHLEGETVSILADGLVQASKVVTAGAITLDTAASVVHVGYNFQSDAKLLPFQAGSAKGTALAKKRRTQEIGLYLYRTLGLKYGYDFDELDECNFRTSEMVANEQADLFSGILHEKVSSDYNDLNQLCLRIEDPLPGTILAVAPQMELQDNA